MTHVCIHTHSENGLFVWLKLCFELNSGFYEGYLRKKGKDKNVFLERKFILEERGFSLSYYNNDNVSSKWADWVVASFSSTLCTEAELPMYATIKESKGPKAVIPIKDLNASFQPGKISHDHGLQITYQENDHTRSIYVYHESAQVGLHHHRCLSLLVRCYVFTQCLLFYI